MSLSKSSDGEKSLHNAENDEGRPDTIDIIIQPKSEHIGSRQADQPVGDHEDNYFGEFLEDHRDVDPLYDANQEALKQRIEEAMSGLNYREREILRLRYGLTDGYAYTLEEVGKIFSVTRERVRQIESKAVRKMQHPYRSNGLRSFLDDNLEFAIDPVVEEIPVDANS